MKRKIIGLCGFIGSGKGTVADILVDDYGFTKIGLADRVKDTAAIMFNWPREMIEGNTPESREWREQPDEWWSDELGYELTPRMAMQRLGTDCMRKGLDDRIWVLMVKKTIQEKYLQYFPAKSLGFFSLKISGIFISSNTDLIH